MSHTLVVDLARNAIMLALLIAGPMLVVALLVGLTVSVLQAVTQIQEQTLAFVPKLVGVAVVFLLALPWMKRWYDAALQEPWRDEPHEEEIARFARVTHDFRAASSKATA